MKLTIDPSILKKIQLSELENKYILVQLHIGPLQSMNCAQVWYCDVRQVIIIIF